MRIQFKILLVFFSLFLVACFSERENEGENQSGSVHETSQSQSSGKNSDFIDVKSYANQTMTVLDIGERSYDGGHALAVTLSIPVDTSDHHGEYFLLNQIGAGVVTANPIVSENGKIIYFPNIEPDTKYRLTVHKGLAGIDGLPLALSAEELITTRNIRADYRFLSPGAFLSLSQYKGLPIEVINTPEINVDFFKVDSDKVPQFISRNRYKREKYYRHGMSYSLNDTSLVYSARYPFDAPKNKRREFNIPIRSIDALASPGVYVAVMSLPGDFQKEVRMTYFTVTDIGMHVRFYPGQAQVLLTSLENQAPLAGINIELLDKDGVILHQTQSSPEGFATIASDLNKGRYLIARDESSLSIVDVNSPALDLSEYELAMRPFAPQELFLYGPRNLYRPGEVAIITGILRDFDGERVASPTLKAELRRPDGSTAQHFTWQSEQMGFYRLDIPIGSDAPTGLWTLDVANVGDNLVSYQFKVEEFLPERLKLTYNDNAKSPLRLNTDKFKVDILGEYLYGAPASQNRFEPRIYYRAKREPFENLKRFQFGDQDEKGLSGKFELADVRLDDAGKAQLPVFNRWKNLKSPVEVSVVGSLFESGGRPVTRSFDTTILPDNHLLGIKPLFEGNPAENSRVSFDILSADVAGKSTALSDIEVTLVREDRRYFWEYSDHEGWHYEWTDKEYVVDSRALATSTADAVKLDFSVEYGNYRIEVKHVSSGAFSSLRFFAGTDWYNNWRDNQSGSDAARPDVVSLAWNKGSYQPGDTATLSIVPPEKGEAIVLVESDRLLWSKRVTVTETKTDVDIPISEDWRSHDIHVSVVHLQYGSKRKSITPSRALGLIHLPLDREPRKLDVAINVDEKIYPNQTYSAQVQVSGHNKQAYVTLAMVDVGVLSLTNFKTPDPHQFFFEPRRFQVDARDMYQKLIELNDSPSLKQRFGGDAALSRGGNKARSDVQIVSLFSGLVAVDENGLANIEFEVPDFNGKVRFMAVAFSDDQFGSQQQEMTIAAPVVTQLSMPRFLANGDSSLLALDLHNLTDTSQALQVQLVATVPLSITRLDSLQLEPGEKTTLTYPVEVGNEIRHANISLAVRGIDDYDIAREWTLAVRAAYPALINKQTKVLQQNQEFSYSMDDGDAVIPETFEAILTVGNSVDLNIQQHMKQLLRYPYGCLEQTTSSTYPWLYATAQSRSMQGVLQGLPAELITNKQAAIEQGLNRIRDKATGNGGFGLWSNTDAEQHWLTAYVGDFLTDARQQGVAIDNELYNSTMNRLQAYAKGKNSDYHNRWSEHEDHYDFAYRAYASYVLSRHQKARISNLRSLVKQADKAKSPLPLVHLGLAMFNQGDTKTGRKLIDDAKHVTRANGYLGDYGSAIRDDALIIRLLLESAVETDYANQLAYTLGESLRSKQYLSTQERNALLLAGIALEQQEGNPWQASLKLNDVISELNLAGRYVNKLDEPELGTGLSVTNTMQNSLFVNLTYQGVPTEKPEPVSKGLSITRTYFDLQGKQISPDTLEVGDLVLVSLKVLARNRHPDLLVIDLLPAGLEIENQNLEHSIKLDKLFVDKFSVADWVRATHIVHQEFRDDRYVAAINLSNNNAGQLFYLARAVTPGKYRLPAPLVEDMYRPQFHATGETGDWLNIIEP